MKPLPMSKNQSFTVIIYLFLLGPFNFFSQDFRNIELLDTWTDTSLLTNSSKVRYNDCWGFLHNGEEYAVAGSTEGTHVFRTTNSKLSEIGFIPGKFSSSQVIHRDFKTFKNYLYAVCDEGNSSLQIIDLNYLPDSISLVADIQGDFGRVHNLYIDTTNALLYAFIVTTLSNGQPSQQYSMRVFNLQNPLIPQLVFTGPNDIAEVHDGYVRNGLAILNCGFDGVRVYDFTNPVNPILLSNLNFYQDQGYNHQGWLSPDGKTYIFGDETNGKRLKKASLNSNGELSIQSLFGTDVSLGSVPHNIMLDEQFAYIAYYNSGFRIYDYTSTPIREVASYDTYPQDAAYKLNGAWGVYSQFPSGRILVSDRENGLFMFQFERDIFKSNAQDKLVVYPNPATANSELIVKINAYFKEDILLELYDYNGKFLGEYRQSNYQYFRLHLNLAAGMYFVKIAYTDANGTKEQFIRKIAVH